MANICKALREDLARLEEMAKSMGVVNYLSEDSSILLFKYDLNIIKVGYQTSKDGKTVEVTQVTSDWSFKNVSCLTNPKVKDSLIKAYFLEVLIHEYGNKLEESMTIAVAIEDFENFCHSKRSDIYGNPGFLDKNQKQHVDSMLSLPVRPLARPATYKDEIEFAPIPASGFELQIKPPAEFYLAKDAEQQELRKPKTLREKIIHLRYEGILNILVPFALIATSLIFYLVKYYGFK